MPWKCPSCGAEAADSTSTCPSCQAAKTSWTVVADVTRVFSISIKRFEVSGGTLARAVRPSDPALQALELVSAEFAPVLAKAKVQELASRGLLPAPSHLLFVALKMNREEAVRVEVPFASRPSDEIDVAVPLPDPAPAEGVVYAKLLCVCGSEDLAPDLFEGITILDLSEDTSEGVAPELDISAFGQAPVELETRLLRRRFRFSF